MIKSFKDKETRIIFERGYSIKLPSTIQRVALRKIMMIHHAMEVKDLRSPPGNYLEALKDNRKGQYSIRINKQWRICFIWDRNAAYEVEIVDYH
jgi:proteic killer suppression protein